MGFREIIGHDQNIRFLQNSIRNGAVAHAYLFCGPQGIGKKLTAFGFAKAINCHKAEEDFCSECDSCQRFEAKVHPDFFLIEPDGQSIKIDQMRQMQASIQYKPYMAKRKVCIIDEADQMSTAAANSILKTLEEPPGDMVLILVVSSVDQILSTILSRCQILWFSPLSMENMERLITQRMTLSPIKARFLAAFSGGSFGFASRLDFSDLQRKREQIFSLTEHLKEMNIEKLIGEAKRLAEEKNLENLQELLYIWMDCYYDIWKYQLTGNEQILINPDQKEYIRKQAKLWSRREIEKNIHVLQAAYNFLKRNANKQLTMEVTLMKLATN